MRVQREAGEVKTNGSREWEKKIKKSGETGDERGEQKAEGKNTMMGSCRVSLLK